jgi:hypothetical protein
MRTHKRMLAAVAGASLVAAALLGAPASAAAKKGPTVVGTDAADDWGSNVDAQLAPAGDQLGMELVEAAIEKVDATTLNFIIKVNSLPASGGVPEVPRYVWTMTVDGELLQLDGKFTNFSRGTCDPTAGNCPPPRNPGTAPFMVRGNCTDNGGNVVTCAEIGLVNATFDAASGTITVPVSLELLGAKAGSKIAHAVQPGSNFAGVWAIPSAWASQGNMPLDELIITKTYTVPKK